MMFNKLHLGLLVVLLAAGCDAGGPPEPPPAQERLPKVVVEHPRRTEYRKDLVLPGTLEPFERAEIFGQVTGYLDAVEVDIGDEVEAGDILARIYAPEAGADVQRARARVVELRSQIKQFEEAQQLAELERARRSSLRDIERGAIAQQDVDAAAAKAEMAGAELSEAEASARRARAELSRARARHQFSTVRAPFGGRVTRRYLDSGALARETSSSAAVPIVELMRVNPLRLVFELPESLVPHVALGHELEVRYDVLPSRVDRAVVARMAGALDPRTRAMRVEADILNEDRALVPGLYASVELTAVAIPDALMLSSRGVRGHGRERHVLVVNGGKLERREVVVVGDDGKRAVIIEGLSEADSVVVSGSPLAVDGVAVEVAEVREVAP